MSRQTLEQLRLPIGIGLLVIVAFILFPRDEDQAADPTPSPTILVGEPGGAIVTTPPSATPDLTATPEPTPTPSPAPTPTPEATPEPTPRPPADDGFTAEILVCRSISGSECNGEISNLPPSASTFTALVRFADANAGDVLNAVLTGPSGTIAGGGYALQGGGDGYYYSNFSAGGLPAGEYVVTATRNGADVAVTTFRKVGG
jgi:hypothetical protein